MRIAFFASAFHPHIGGVEELVRQLALELGRRGSEAIVITNRWPRSLPAYEFHQGIHLYRLALRTPVGGAKAVLTYLASTWQIQQQVKALLRKHQTEIVHVQCVSSNGLYARHAARALRLPLIVSAHGERTMDAGRIYERSCFMNRLLKQLLAEAAFVTACSGDTLRDLETYRGQEFGARGSVFYSGIHLEDFASAQPHQHPKPYIIALGRLVPQKGFDVLLEAFREIADEIPHDLLLAGEGPEQERLEKLALSGRVHLVGRADRTQVPALFAGSSFFVLPSRQEPQGIVNLEAMASGKAVIATRVGGVAEIVPDGKVGLLVPGGESAPLATAIRKLALDPALAQQMGAAGREHAASFAWPQIADQYEALYRQATHPSRKEAA